MVSGKVLVVRHTDCAAAGGELQARSVRWPTMPTNGRAVRRPVPPLAQEPMVARTATSRRRARARSALAVRPVVRVSTTIARSVGNRSCGARRRCAPGWGRSRSGQPPRPAAPASPAVRDAQPPPPLVDAANRTLGAPGNFGGRQPPHQGILALGPRSHVRWQAATAQVRLPHLATGFGGGSSPDVGVPQNLRHVLQHGLATHGLREFGEGRG
jgi:hypothetical protein